MENPIPDPKPMGLEVNRDQAALLLKGLQALPAIDQQGVNYQALKRDIETILVIWDRTIKNQKIVKEMQRQKNKEKK